MIYCSRFFTTSKRKSFLWGIYFPLFLTHSLFLSLSLSLCFKLSFSLHPLCLCVKVVGAEPCLDKIVWARERKKGFLSSIGFSPFLSFGRKRKIARLPRSALRLCAKYLDWMGLLLLSSYFYFVFAILPPVFCKKYVLQSFQT